MFCQPGKIGSLETSWFSLARHRSRIICSISNANKNTGEDFWCSLYLFQWHYDRPCCSSPPGTPASTASRAGSSAFQRNSPQGCRETHRTQAHRRRIPVAPGQRQPRRKKRHEAEALARGYLALLVQYLMPRELPEYATLFYFSVLVSSSDFKKSLESPRFGVKKSGPHTDRLVISDI